MSVVKSQTSQSVKRGQSSVTATVVQLTAASDTLEVARMQAESNCVIQLRRPGDPEVTVSQTDIDTVALTGSVGQEVLIVTLHDDPAVETV
jgi:hypothetical protein